jgi:predicted acylesterase/phospholipase RssA
MKTNPRLRGLETAMDEAANYAEWRGAAQEHDQLTGALEWVGEAESENYDWRLLKSRTELLRRLRRRGDVSRLLFYLHEELHGNLGNMANPALYGRAKTGTKRLIRDYLDEVVDILETLCNLDESTLSRERKLRFFRQAAHSFGRSALVLSGGATLGLFHLGVIKALWSEGLLPIVLSGSSAGSIVASIVATHDDSELAGVFDPGYVKMEAWRDFGLDHFFKGRGLGNIDKLRRAINRNVTKYTFEEAFERTGRVVNVSVSPADPNQFPRLLNFHNAPNVYVRRAVLASCALPGLFPPVVLQAKSFRGHTVPYMPRSSWQDGSLKMDVPKNHLSRMHNVNHFIVSQTNPHVVPFLSDRHPESSALFFLELIKSTARVNVEHILDRLRQHAHSPALSMALDKAHAVATQTYSGDITIFPTRQAGNILQTFADPTPDQVARFVTDGERATWPILERIRNTTSISRSFERCLRRLNRRTRPQA